MEKLQGTLKEVIGQAIGRASVCWSEIPQGVFDSTTAGELVGQILDKINDKEGPFNFGTAIELLKAGKMVQRAGWNGKGMFIVKQIPATIGLDIIPKMQSLPQSVKDYLVSKQQPISYTNQMLIVNADGRADSWVPSSSDVFAEDWSVIE